MFKKIESLKLRLPTEIQHRASNYKHIYQTIKIIYTIVDKYKVENLAMLICLHTNEIKHVRIQELSLCHTF